VTSTSAHPVRYGRPSVRGGRRRRIRLLLGLLVVSALAFGIVGLALRRWAGADSRRDYLSSDGWPSTGQGAYHVSGKQPAASPNERPAPIASLAKVMTAYLVLRAHPLASGGNGFAMTVTAHDVADTQRRRALDQSLVEVRAGEVLTERQALMALLLPSANNVAVMLARRVSGSVRAFVAEMNRTAKRLGMHETTYTDPSGFDSQTVSTATDQLILAEQVARDPVLAAMMATRSYELPVAGTVHNTDTLLGSQGFVGMKTGSEDAAGGCFMFHVRRRSGGHLVDLVGVVLGQSGHNLIDAGLYAARQLADRLLPA
jgi:D-alanyl-D-alanine carboxypeptidase (penicillin-binding protein 5/6)